jgi:phosphatidylinositol alpha-mannosyltransferase
MRIALVCPYSLTVPGGVQTQVLGLARALGARGDEVAVVGPAEESEVAGRLDEAALGGAVLLRVGSGRPVSVNGSRAPVAPWPAAMARAVSALRGFAPEVVHVHEPFVPGPSLAAVVAGPRPTVGTFHRAGNDLAYRAYGHLVGVWARRLDAVFAVSEEAARTAQACIGHLPANMGIIPNGVEADLLASVEPWPSSAPTVLFVGRHEHRKGLGVLLDAFEALPAPAQLWVVGEGPETGRLRARCASQARVVWLGAVDDAERARRLAGADVLAAPSLSGESFGLVLLEAMAAGTAVVASDLPGYRLAAAGAARLVPPGDAGALARALLEVLGDAAQRADLREGGLRRARECDMRAIADAYREVYSRLGGGGGE